MLAINTSGTKKLVRTHNVKGANTGGGGGGGGGGFFGPE